MTYTCAAGSAAVLEIGSNVQEIQIQNLPIGNYDAAEITVGEDTYRTAGRGGRDYSCGEWYGIEYYRVPAERQPGKLDTDHSG